MDELGRLLCSFGLDPIRVKEALKNGKIDDLLDALKKEEDILLLRSAELDDLREELLTLAEEERLRKNDELSDEDIELLSAAGGEKRIHI